MRTFADLLSARVSQSPDSTAYRFLATGDVDGEVQELSYAGLGRRSRAIGGWLQEQGFAGGRALLLFPPGLEFVTAFMGCVVSGVVAVPCSPPYGRQAERALRRIGTLVADAGARVVLTTAPFRDAVRAAAELIPELAALTWVAVETIPDLAEERWREPGTGADAIAFLQYTSGSTSAPRGVMVSHGNLLDNLQVIAEAFDHTPERIAEHDGDLMVSWLPAFHDMGLIGGVLQSFYVGRDHDALLPAALPAEAGTLADRRLRLPRAHQRRAQLRVRTRPARRDPRAARAAGPEPLEGGVQRG
jgi:acyl-CoA synthetase (AMP-forming)/AMP-acid ligase II